jgi:hypothetical protein
MRVLWRRRLADGFALRIEAKTAGETPAQLFQSAN